MENIELILSRINGGNNNSFKQLYGTDTDELQKQALRYSEVLKKFQETFNSSQAAIFSSPGRSEIGGNHTDHNHGRVLAGAINLDNIAVAAKNNTTIIRILSLGYSPFELDLSILKPDQKEFYTSESLVRGICSRMKELGFTIGGFDAVIDGKVPKGSGLSSSASFEVLIGSILSHLFNNGKLDAITNAIIGQYAENVFFGKPCGLMDQTACAVGGFITIDFKDPLNPIVKKVDFDFATTGFALVITDTGGNHADLNDEYASLPIEMKSVAKELDATVLREVTLEQIVEAIPELRKKTGDRAILRAYHFQGDNSRVVKQVEALEQNDFPAFLQMVINSGYSSFMYNQNIYPVNNVKEQGVSLALALSEMILKGQGAWRDFASTVAKGLAIPEMCHTFNLRNKQEYIETLRQTNRKLAETKKALKESEELARREKEIAQSASDMMNNMLEKLPTGVVIVDNNLKILHSNHSFINIIGEDAKVIADVIPGLAGADIKTLIPFNVYNMFTFVIKEDEPVVSKDVHFEDKMLNISIFPIKKNKMCGAIIRDLYSPEVQGEEVTNRVTEVIEKNLEMVQKIGFLLGEGASETEQMLNSIIESYKSRKGGKTT